MISLCIVQCASAVYEMAANSMLWFAVVACCGLQWWHAAGAQQSVSIDEVVFCLNCHPIKEYSRTEEVVNLYQQLIYVEVSFLC